MRINQPFRSQEEAQTVIGKYVRYEGSKWKCVDHNDLGALYWARVGTIRQFCGPGLDAAACAAGHILCQ